MQRLKQIQSHPKTASTVFNFETKGGGIYLHIPFCKQACYYCDFHFSTSIKKKAALIEALVQELILRKDEMASTPVETIYFGGGTPSILSVDDILWLITTIYEHYTIITNPEITLEANPDDLSETKIIALSKTQINRLSIGIQSFFDQDLQLMNRAHNSKEAKNCLSLVTSYFKNITIDLIYGIPYMSNERWQENIQMALNFNIPHISSYALTVEPKTALKHLIKAGKIDSPNEQITRQQFEMLVERLTQAGFVHYEFSNFGKPDYFSKHNTSYWFGKPYLGIGPSAHSFDGVQRSWNVANNSKYIQSIQQGILPAEKEILTLSNRYNEYVMTGLRTIWGVSLHTIQYHFGDRYVTYLEQQAQKYCAQQLLYFEDDVLKTTPKGLFLSDGIAADLFMV